MFIPKRRSQLELLDQDPAADAVLARNLREMTLLYRLTGGLGLGLSLVRSLIKPDSRILDVAAGDGSVAQLIAQNIHVPVVACDRDGSVCQIAARSQVPVIQADGLKLPFADHAFAVVHCSQALHHFTPEQAVKLLTEMDRVARNGGVIVDLKRSWWGWLGAWLITRLPFFTPLARHDGPLSVLKAYTLAEVYNLANQANVEIKIVLENPIYWAIHIH